MKIAIFCPTVSGFGGMETALVNLLSGFKAIGEDCRLFMLGGSIDETWLREVPHTSISDPRDRKLLKLAKYAIQPAMELALWRPDAIVASDATTLQMARLARLLTANPRMRIASWVHFPLIEVRRKEWLRFADCHLTISAGIAKNIKAFLPRNAENVFTIYNSTDVGAPALLPRSASAVFLYIGRLTYDDHKRVNDLLVALSMLHGDFRAKIIGSAPPERPSDGTRLRALARELGLDDKIEWLGWQSKPWAAAGSASALVMTSAREAFGMVLLEALARGLPCISSDCESGPRELIEPGANGWLFPVADVEALAARLQRVINEPGCLPAQEDVRRTVERFSLQAVALRARSALLLCGKQKAASE